MTEIEKLVELAIARLDMNDTPYADRTDPVRFDLMEQIQQRTPTPYGVVSTITPGDALRLVDEEYGKDIRALAAAVLALLAALKGAEGALKEANESLSFLAYSVSTAATPTETAQKFRSAAKSALEKIEAARAALASNSGGGA